MTEAGREFQVVGAAQLNDRLLMTVRLKVRRHGEEWGVVFSSPSN